MRTDDAPPALRDTADTGVTADTADTVDTGARPWRAFVDHLVVFVAVDATLWTSWLVVAPGTGAWSPWPLTVTAGWGAVLAAHALSAAGRAG